MVRCTMHTHTAKPVEKSNGTSEGSFQIPHGQPFEDAGAHTLHFEVQFFKYNAAPQYLVKYDPQQWSCTCPDFRRHTGVMCKHCTACHHSLSPMQRAGGNYPLFLQLHIRPISPEQYEQMRMTPIGRPLPPTAYHCRLLVRFPGDTVGFVEYSRDKWHCWTCGGPDGVALLNKHMCKHVACFVKSWSDPTYTRLWTRERNPRQFERERKLQRKRLEAHWQRFRNIEQ